MPLSLSNPCHQCHYLLPNALIVVNAIFDFVIVIFSLVIIIVIEHLLCHHLFLFSLSSSFCSVVECLLWGSLQCRIPFCHANWKSLPHQNKRLDECLFWIVANSEKYMYLLVFSFACEALFSFVWWKISISVSVCNFIDRMRINVNVANLILFDCLFCAWKMKYCAEWKMKRTTKYSISITMFFVMKHVLICTFLHESLTRKVMGEWSG